MEQFLNTQQWNVEWIDPHLFQPSFVWNDSDFYIPPPDTGSATSSTTPSSSSSLSDIFLEGEQTPNPRKRRQTSECSQSEALVRPRKTRIVKDPHETARTRLKGACFSCKKNRKPCQDGDDPDGPCKSCLERSHKVTYIPGLLRPLCWRPNIGYTEVFRRGPTYDFAASLRGNMKDAGPGKQALWKHFGTGRSGTSPTKLVELSQNTTANVLKLELHRYQPKEGDKQYYSWYDNDEEFHYQTPAYGVPNVHAATSEIEKFLALNAEGYLEEHLRSASEITRKTFQTARNNKHLPLVERALKLWIGCRFIEDPWSIVGSETLSMAPDPHPSSPYHTRIPVPPIVDLQIDLIVINEILQPELKKILKMLKTMLESSDPWTNWFEIYLSYFVLLHNVELTMKHDAWFVRRNNLKRKYSNKNLVDTIMSGATTLLTCFHYAHQGYAPFSTPSLETSQPFTADQKSYLADVRSLLGRMRGDHVVDPARELFWTSQLWRPDWRPAVLVS